MCCVLRVGLLYTSLVTSHNMTNRCLSLLWIIFFKLEKRLVEYHTISTVSKIPRGARNWQLSFTFCLFYMVIHVGKTLNVFFSGNFFFNTAVSDYHVFTFDKFQTTKTLTIKNTHTHPCPTGKCKHRSMSQDSIRLPVSFFHQQVNTPQPINIPMIFALSSVQWVFLSYLVAFTSITRVYYETESERSRRKKKQKKKNY